MSSHAIAVLGSTGSIGQNTLDIIRRHPERYQVYALCANTNVDKMFAQCEQFHPQVAVMGNKASAKRLKNQLKDAGSKVEVLSGKKAIVKIAAHEKIDTVMSAIVGAIGLKPTLAAVKSGKKVLIANKEPLVMLGNEIIRLARKYNASIVPVDSEHNAIFQCIPVGGQWGVSPFGVEKMYLTGSGGPFRQLPVAELAHVTPEQACDHPNWCMGPKISVDSATMMNKGLELIEACALFDIKPDMIQIVVHPQSVIHSMVQYVDGSILAQLGAPDMRTPIAHALAWPDRIESGTKRLDLFELARFDFEPPDEDKFPALRLAREAAMAGGTLPSILNAANEVAVDAFLNRRISFTKIPQLVESAMSKIEQTSTCNLATVLEADQRTRSFTEGLI